MVLSVPSAFAQAPDTSEIGIDQKLGQTVFLDLPFYDETGATVTLGRLMGGKPAILALVYYRCLTVCPLMLNGLRQLIETMRDLAPGKDYRVLCVSFNPNEDHKLAAAQKNNFMAALENPIPEDAWRFITSPVESARALTAQVGFRYKQVGQDFVHPAALIVLSPQGKIVRYVKGVSGYNPVEFEMALGAAGKEQVAQTSTASARSSLIQICFGYDPKGGAAPLIFRIIGVLTALAVLGFGVVVYRAGKTGRGGRNSISNIQQGTRKVQVKAEGE